MAILRKLLNAKTLLSLLLSTGLIIIFITILIYYKHAHISFWGDIDNGLFGEFGEFIGGVVGTIFNLVVIGLLWLTYKEQQKELKETKSLIRSQINLSLKPDLFIIDSEFTAYSEVNALGETFPLLLTSGKLMKEDPKGPVVKLVNVGVAVAKYVNYSWSFDLQQIIKYIKKHYDTEAFELEVDNNKPHAKIGLKDRATHFVNYNVDDRFDVLLPYKNESEVKLIMFPQSYLACYCIAYHLFIQTVPKLNNPHFITDFPKCHLKISYSDIADNIHHKHFSFKVDFGYMYTRVKDEFEMMFEGAFIGLEEKSR